jgi:hypothetical protein
MSTSIILRIYVRETLLYLSIFALQILNNHVEDRQYHSEHIYRNDA